MNNRISLIAVIAKNRGIGKNNQLLWHIPEDLQRFKKITLGHPVVMGRNTYESLGRPLPGRANIVIARETDYEASGAVTVRSIPEALELAKKEAGGEEIFIIGGGQIYTQTIGLADRLYLTIVDQESEADTFFPAFDEWQRIIEEEKITDTAIPHTFRILEK
jgi:dihydrofolate reductase